MLQQFVGVNNPINLGAVFRCGQRQTKFINAKSHKRKCGFHGDGIYLAEHRIKEFEVLLMKFLCAENIAVPKIMAKLAYLLRN